MFVAAPGVASAIIHGSNGGGTFQHQTYWNLSGGTAAWTVTDLQNLVNQIQTFLKSACQSTIPNWNTYNSVTGIDLTSNTGVTAVSTAPSFSGTKVATLMTFNDCMVLNQQIALRYRGGHPRIYLGWGGSGDVTGGNTWVGSACTAVATAWANMVSGVHAFAFSSGTNTCNQVVPRYTYTYTDQPAKHKYYKTRSGYIGQYTIQNYSVRPLVCSVKGRLVP